MCLSVIIALDLRSCNTLTTNCTVHGTRISKHLFQTLILDRDNYICEKRRLHAQGHKVVDMCFKVIYHI